eukprot:c21517_g1_i3.p1 GENE.c21517_g1_i3~~c21517_g1_i3.p1  ORF type:complete len:188 (+),score=79.21 c21517_g1_i3:69-632(+)
MIQLSETKAATLKICIHRWQNNSVSRSFNQWKNFIEEEKIESNALISSFAFKVNGMMIRWSNERKKQSLLKWHSILFNEKAEESNNSLLELKRKREEELRLAQEEYNQSEIVTNKLLQEKQTSHHHAEKMKSEFEQYRSVILGQCLHRVENRNLQHSVQVWRRWNRAQIYLQVEKLQQSMRKFEDQY